MKNINTSKELSKKHSSQELNSKVPHLITMYILYTSNWQLKWQENIDNRRYLVQHRGGYRNSNDNRPVE